MNSSPTSGHAPPRVAAKRVLLGLFVTGQFLFLLLSNLLPFLPHGREQYDELIDDVNLHGQTTQVEPVQYAIEGIACVTDRWMEATGQLQGWSLFAPTFPPQAGFVSVRLGWNDGYHDLVKSRFEPDPLYYFRWPGTYGRQFNYESRFVILPAYWPESRLGRSWWPWEMEWSEAITRRVQVQWKSMRAYLRWRRDRYMKEHPNAPPPTEAVLSIDLYLTPLPNQRPWKPQGPSPRLLARWRPDVVPPAGQLPVEVCIDPTQETFVWVPPKGEW